MSSASWDAGDVLWGESGVLAPLLEVGVMGDVKLKSPERKWTASGVIGAMTKRCRSSGLDCGDVVVTNFIKFSYFEPKKIFFH